MSKPFKLIFNLLPLLFIVGVTTLVILVGRGYRIDLKKTDLKSTGLLVTRSDPDGAQVYIDGKLKTATNNTINIDPGWYTVKIRKEGFLPWEKYLRVQGEVVTNTNAFLFPTNPSLSPLTATGIINPTLSPDGTKLAYIVPKPNGSENNGLDEEKSGLWILTMTDQPLAFNRDPKQIAPQNMLPTGDKQHIIWSPDSTQILVLSQTQAFLFDTDKKDSFADMTYSIPQLTVQWGEQQNTKKETQDALLPKKIGAVIKESATILSFSPDETKVLYQATASAAIPPIIEPALIGANPTQEERMLSIGDFYVYDIKEDKNYFVLGQTEVVSPKAIPPQFTDAAMLQLYESFAPHNYPLLWFPTSRHIIVQIPGKIDIMEYDRINWITVYSGPHEEGFVVPWPGSSRLLILTNLNTKASTLPNLYTVNLR